MPTEETQKGEIYFKTEDDKEYKKLGRGTVTEINYTEAENKPEEIKKLSLPQEVEVMFNIITKRYKHKRFKKLLMSKGVQRNAAEYCSRYFKRTQFILDLLSQKESSDKNDKRTKSYNK